MSQKGKKSKKGKKGPGAGGDRKGEHIPLSAMDKTEEVEKKVDEGVSSKMSLLDIDCQGDGDQSPLKGEEAQLLRTQWSGGMSYNPLKNSDHSSWLLALWCGDYGKTMAFLNNKSAEAVNMQLDVRESLLNVCGIFHVIIGARTLCGDSPLFRGIKREALKTMDVKFEHIKILKKILELGANVNVKDVAGYTPLHHCLTKNGNSETVIMAEMLLEAGANPNLQNRLGCTPMFEPLMAVKLDYLSLLLKFGGDPAIKDNDGFSCDYIGTAVPGATKLFGAATRGAIKEKRKELKEAAGGSLRKCNHCGQAVKNPKRCTGCYLVWYCGPCCQKEAWPGHSKECEGVRKQYKKVLLMDQDMQMVDRLKGGKLKTHKLGEQPAKTHFVAKIQVCLGALDDPNRKDITTSGMLLYNEERSVSGYVFRVPGQEDAYDEIFQSIKQRGWRGLKGYFYCILQNVDTKDGLKDTGMGLVSLEINTTRVLPPETW